MYIWYEILTNPRTGKDYGSVYAHISRPITYNTDPSEACLMIPKAPGDWNCE